ncbi:MAG: phosphatase PAP2 family protein [bacterium]
MNIYYINYGETIFKLSLKVILAGICILIPHAYAYAEYTLETDTAVLSGSHSASSETKSGVNVNSSGKSYRKLLTAVYITGGISVLATQDTAIRRSIRKSLQKNGDFLNIKNIGHKLSFFDYMGRPEGTLGTAAVFYIAGYLKGSEKNKKTGVLAAEAWLIGSILPGCVKITAGRKRPRSSPDDSDVFIFLSGNDSFPSGHTSSAFAVATVVADSHDSGWIKTASYSVAGLVGVGRIFQDYHWTSDVLAGAFLGYSSAKLVEYWDTKSSWNRSFYTNGRGIYFTQRF